MLLYYVVIQMIADLPTWNPLLAGARDCEILLLGPFCEEEFYTHSALRVYGLLVDDVMLLLIINSN